jgi:hypothetical protein
MPRPTRSWYVWNAETYTNVRQFDSTLLLLQLPLFEVDVDGTSRKNKVSSHWAVSRAPFSFIKSLCSMSLVEGIMRLPEWIPRLGILSWISGWKSFKEKAILSRKYPSVCPPKVYSDIYPCLQLHRQCPKAYLVTKADTGDGKAKFALA